MHACVLPYISLQLLSICLTSITAGRRTGTLTTPTSCKSSGKWAPALRGGRLNYNPGAEAASRLALRLQRIQCDSHHRKKPGCATPAACGKVIAQQRESSQAVASHKVPCSSGSRSSTVGKGLRQPLVHTVVSHSFIKEQLFWRETP